MARDNFGDKPKSHHAHRSFGASILYDKGLLLPFAIECDSPRRYATVVQHLIKSQD